MNSACASSVRCANRASKPMVSTVGAGKITLSSAMITGMSRMRSTRISPGRSCGHKYTTVA